MQMWSRKPSQHYRFWEERHPSNLPSPTWQPSTAAEANTTSFPTLAFVMLLHNQHCWSPAAAPALKAVYKNPSFACLFGLILAPLLLFTEPLTAVGISPVKQVVLKNITGETSGNYHSLYIFQLLGFVTLGYTLAIFLVSMGLLNTYIEVLSFYHATWHRS